jgi:hypothetical protein
MKIKLLHRDEIDRAKWNGCVHYAPNSLIYAYTWYLDNVCDNWMGLVEEDYESVFPLVWNDKLLGYKRLFQPYLCQQLGLFSVNALNEKRINAFLKAIPNDFRLVDINLNDGNTLNNPDNFIVSEKPNYVLSLYPSYEKIAAKYNSNLKRNLKKAENENFFASTDLKPEVFVEAVKRHHKNKGNVIPPEIYHTALRIIYNCQHRGQGSIMTVYNEKEELCAAVFWMINGARFINLLNVTTEEGRNNGAMHYLIDMFIRSNSGKTMYIDFEGSSIDSIARFYQGFGAENLPFFNIRRNSLPWWFKLFKK